ncbi:unnamed protein product [Natator depressus]
MEICLCCSVETQAPLECSGRGRVSCSLPPRTSLGSALRKQWQLLSSEIPSGLAEGEAVALGLVQVAVPPFPSCGGTGEHRLKPKIKGPRNLPVPNQPLEPALAAMSAVKQLPSPSPCCRDGATDRDPETPTRACYTRSSAASEAIPHGALGCAGSLPILYRPTASCRAGQGGILGVKMFKQRCSCWTLNKQRPHSKVKNVQRGNSLHADPQARGFV